MTLARAIVESMLVDRDGPWLAEADGMDAATKDGTNASLNGPIRAALSKMGLPPADPTAVADADLLALDPADDLDELLDRAELALLLVVRTRLTDTSIVIQGAVQTSTSNLLPQINAIIDALERRVARLYGAGGSSVSAGVINLGGMAAGEGE